MWILREKRAQIERLVTQYKVVVLTGARQVGKSSLLKKYFPSWNYISLDLPSDAALAEEDSERFLESHKAPLIIDEIQYAPNLFRFIKSVVDKNPEKSGQYILTGSQKFTLMKEVQESLAGRAAITELLPLSINEIKQVDKPLELESLILRGGMPALYQNLELEFREFQRSYLLTYLERDVKEILNVSSLRDYERFLRICASRCGSLINKSEIAKDVGKSSTTISEWLSILQTSNQVMLLEPWFTNKSKSVIKSPKLYFLDTGLLCFLLNISDEETLANSPFKGAIFENFVFSELYKRLSIQNEQESLFFWRDRGKEIDFLIDRGGVLDVFEVKWSANPDRSMTKNIDFFKNSPAAKTHKFRHQGLITSSKKTYPLSGNEYTNFSFLDVLTP